MPRDPDDHYATALLDAVAGYIFVLDTDGYVRQINQAARRALSTFGLTVDDCVGRYYLDYVGAAMPTTGLGSEFVGRFEQAVRGEIRSFEVEYAVPLVHEERWFQVVLRSLEGPRPGLVVSNRDVTDRHRAVELLAEQARSDALTGLATRTALLERLAELSDAGRQFSLLFIDLDDFKQINDTHGHRVGDDLLYAVGRRLAVLDSPGRLAARFGGDEFVVVDEVHHSEAGARQLATEIRSLLSLPVATEGTELSISASVGITLSSRDDAASADTLLAEADAAMYAAKSAGRNRTVTHDPRAAAVRRRRWRIEQELRGVTETDQLEMLYQPIVDVRTGVVLSAEALLRWNSATLGPVTSEEFIVVAEQHGHMRALGRWVFEQVSAQLADWRDRGSGPASVAVNLSPRQLGDPTLVRHLEELLRAADLPTMAVSLEVTETAIAEDPVEAERRLHELAWLGFNIVLDDFGAGYGSLSHLSRLPITGIKIDRQFIHGIGRRRRDEAIIQSLFALADRLALDVISEGIETESQRRFLLAQGASLGQGFLFSPPVPAETIDWVNPWEDLSAAGPRSEPAGW